jgi:hypothetical protein
MNPRSNRLGEVLQHLLVVVCTVALISGDTRAYLSSQQEQSSASQSRSPADHTPKIPPDQLDSLVAPIALYSDPLLTQTLAASTYPLEIVRLHTWLAKNPGLKDKALADAVAKQPWDPSIQAMAALPDLVKHLADDIQWTTDLGNAFLAQQSDAMDAVQHMRKKAQHKGNLKSTEQRKVETKTVENKSVIVIEQANPQVVYVPSYDPVVVYGPPVYPYPPIYCPPPGYYAAGMAISFEIGVGMVAFWGWLGLGLWLGANNINNNNFFNGNSNTSVGNRTNVGGNRGGNWQHNPHHRGGAPYRDRATADRFCGTTRGDLLGRQAAARQRVGRQGGNLASNRTGGGGIGNVGWLGGGNRGGAAGAEVIRGQDLPRGGCGNRNGFAGGSRGSGAAQTRGPAAVVERPVWAEAEVGVVFVAAVAEADA